MEKDDFVILGVGQIQPRKGVEAFIEVANKLPRFKFVWVGGRPIKKLTAGSAKLDRLIKQSPKNIYFTKEVPYEKMPLYYNASDIFSFPPYQETQGLVVIEAACVGLPLVLRDLTEYKLLYKEGYLVGEDEDFASIIAQLHKDKAYYNCASQEARNLSRKFTFDALGDKLTRIYKNLLNQR